MASYRGFSYEPAKNKPQGIWRLEFPDGHKTYTEAMDETALKQAIDGLVAATPGHKDP